MAALKTALVIFSIFRILGLRNIVAIDDGPQQQVSQFTTSADLITAYDVPALFVFGDSIVDTGNNNWLFTLARADFPPYGQNFMNSVPTGRFSDGPLVEDYLANFLGLPLVPPYAAAGDNITKGACFASAGSGIFDTTGKIYGQVIPLSKQIEHFGEVKLSLAARLGEEEASLLVSKALFLVVAGSDDFLGHYRANSILISPSHNQSNYIFSSAFQESLLSQFIDQIQALYDLGARKIAIFNVPAVGCVPSMLNIQADGECVSSLNEAVTTYNGALLASITSMQTSNLAEAHLVYCNAFDIAIQIITRPSQYGLDDAKTACCGWGEYNGAVPCLPLMHEVCQNASNHVFWDFVHPSSATYEIVANAFWNGSNEYTTPINLQQLSSR